MNGISLLDFALVVASDALRLGPEKNSSNNTTVMAIAPTEMLM